METMQTGKFSEQTEKIIIQMSFDSFIEYANHLINGEVDKKYALICMNINNISFIDNVFGASISNQVLEYVMDTIVQKIGDTGAASRFSTESFIVIIGYDPDENISERVNSVSKSIKEFKVSEQYDFSVNTVSSIYLLTEDCHDISITKIADNLMIAIKHSNMTSGFFYYDNAIHERMSKELEIVKSVDDAIKNHEFHIYLQPQHYLQHEDRVLSAEALVRWIKSDGTMIFPNDFIPILEKNGLISKLDCHVMELACRFISDHIDEAWFDGIVISVNVSKVDLKLRDFIEYYTNIRNKYQIPDGKIEIEFTESAVFEDYTIFKQIMFELRKSGFYCSIDDFGTGSSSLNMLKSMPVDVLKMDRMFFVCDNENDLDRNNSVIASVVAMARGLGMKIVAEGIESPEKIDFLRKIGCDVIQGYVYSKPLSVDEFEQYVKNYIPKYLPLSEKIHLVPPKEYTTLDAESAYEKYVQMLPYVNALVIELDIDEDTYNVASFGQNEIYFTEITGSYSNFVENIILKNIHHDYRDMAITEISLKGIIAAFYRGDREIRLEIEMKRFDDKSGEMEDEYRWWLVHVCFQKVSKNSKPMAIVFISDIQEKKDQERSIISAENRLKAAIKSIKCEIYSVNLRDHTAILLHGGKKDDAVPQSIDEYIDMWAHPDDKDRLHRIVNSRECSRFLETHSEEDYYTEYRIVKANKKIKWKSLHCMTTSEFDDYGAFVIIQDITEHKLLEEKMAKSEQTLYNFFASMCVCVFEIGIKTDYFRIIKAEKDVEDFFNTNNEHTAYTYQIEKLLKRDIIHRDDLERFRNIFYNNNFKNMLNDNGNISVEYRLMTSSGYRWFEAKAIQNSTSNMIFVYDIDEKKDNEFKKRMALRCDKNTGAYTKEDFCEIVSDYSERDGISGEHIVIMADIDDFDEIKAEKGEEYTEKLLLDFAKYAKKSVRKDDIIGKIGNGMFLMFLKNTGRSNVMRIMMKIRSIFEAEKPEGDESIGFSTGIAVLCKNDKSIDRLYSEAQSALTEAHKMGETGTDYIYDRRR